MIEEELEPPVINEEAERLYWIQSDIDQLVGNQGQLLAHTSNLQQGMAHSVAKTITILADADSFEEAQAQIKALSEYAQAQQYLAAIEQGLIKETVTPEKYQAALQALTDVALILNGNKQAVIDRLKGE